MVRLGSSVSLSALVMALAIATPAVAQEQTSASDDTPATTQAQSDDDITDTAAVGAAQRSAAITGGDVVVTGTRIRRPNLGSAAPITSVTVQDIQAQAPVTVEEVLNRLPQFAPDAQQNYSDSDGKQRIKLRSLGFERTLVLIDGKRLGTMNGQDTGLIPASLLQRVDVLSGGASSVYGSDAISGVVNFILRKDFKGVRIDADYGFYNHLNKDTIVSPIARNYSFASPTGLTNDGGRANLMITAGDSLLDGALNYSAFFNYRTQERVGFGSRSYSPCYLLQANKDGPLSCQLSTYSTSGYISPRSGPNNGTAYVNNPNGTGGFVPYGPGAGNAANPYDNYAHQRGFERYTSGGFVNWEIAPEAELYASGIWNRDQSRNAFPSRIYSYTAFGSDPYQVNCDNPFMSPGQRTALCGAQTTGLVPLDLRYRFDGLPSLDDVYTNSAFRATGGVRGKVGEAFDYDVGGVFARNKSVYRPSAYADPVRVNRALNVVSVGGVATCAAAVSGLDPACVPFNAFIPGNNDPASTDYLLAGQSGFSYNETFLYDVVASVTGDFTKYGVKSPWAEQGLAVALATEYREDRYTDDADAVYRQQNGGTASDISQHVWESNIEVQAPLVQQQSWTHLLQVNGGFRLSKYNTNPDKFTTWKIEGLWSPVRDITLRASFNKAQRAPTPLETRQATRLNYSLQGDAVGDFCAPRQITDPANPGQTIAAPPLASREVCRATGLPDALYGSPTLVCPDNRCTVREGGYTADPETGYTQTYGLVLQPRFLKGFVFSVDYFRIKIDNSLGYQQESYFREGCLRSNGDPFFCQGIARAPNGTLSSPPSGNPSSGFIRAGLSNYYISQAAGYDFQTQYTLGLGSAGRLDWGFNGSLTTQAIGQDSPIRPRINCVGYYGNSCNQHIPEWKHTLRTTYTSPDNVFNASLNWRHIGKLTHSDNSGREELGGTPDRVRTTFYEQEAVDYFDLSVAFNVAKRMSLRVTANNLFDRVPPLIANSRTETQLYYSNFTSALYDALGRQIVFSTTFQF